jgi:hypothetical protein
MIPCSSWGCASSTPPTSRVSGTASCSRAASDGGKPLPTSIWPCRDLACVVGGLGSTSRAYAAAGHLQVAIMCSMPRSDQRRVLYWSTTKRAHDWARSPSPAAVSCKKRREEGGRRCVRGHAVPTPGPPAVLHTLLHVSPKIPSETDRN